MKLKTLLLTLLLITTSGSVLAEFPSERMSDPDRDLYESDYSDPYYDGPIIDSHFHITPRRYKGDTESAVEDLFEALSYDDVINIIEMPTPNDTKSNQRKRLLTLDIIKKVDSGNWFKSFCEPTGLPHLYMSGASNRELDAALERLSVALEDNSCIGIGEFGPYHFAKTRKQHVIVMPLTFNPFLKMLSMIEDSGKYLVLHMEPMDSDGGLRGGNIPNTKSYHDDTLKLLDEILEGYPDLKLVLAHTAMTNSGNLKYLLDKYPNLISSVKIRGYHPRKGHWNSLEPIYRKNERLLYEDWAILFESYSDRFVIETDFKFLRAKNMAGGDGKRYIKKDIRRIRKILGQLSIETAEKIAYKNAQKYFLKY